MPVIYAVSCDYQISFKSTLFLLLHPTEKLPSGSLFYVQNNLSRSVKTIDGSPCCLHQATAVQHFSFQSPEPSAIFTALWETAEKTRRRSFELIVVVKRCDKFIMTGQSALYFKSSGKVKSKWPLGGRLWILLESIWLKIKVVVCTIIVVCNS